MNKIIIPYEVAEAIEKLRGHWSDWGVISRAADGQEPAAKTIHNYFSIVKEGRVLLLQALACGYEVEKTPEEKVRAYYKQAVQDVDSGDYDRIFTGRAAKDAILFVLDAYGIKLEGVNAIETETSDD